MDVRDLQIPPDVAQHGDHGRARLHRRATLARRMTAASHRLPPHPPVPADPSRLPALSGRRHRRDAALRGVATSATCACAPGSTNINLFRPVVESSNVGELLRVVHRRNYGAAALLYRRDDRPLPAIVAAALRHGLHRHIGPPAHKWLHGRHTQHDSVADDAVHLVALEQRLRQRHGDARFGSRGARLDSRAR